MRLRLWRKPKIDRSVVEQLDLKWPVDITVGIPISDEHPSETSASGEVRGLHRLRFINGGCRHEIVISKSLNRYRAQRALWHELGHAVDAENRVGHLPWDDFEKQQWYAAAVMAQRAIPYEERPSELFAKSFEARA